MDKTILSKLEELGLSNKEASLYLSLLALEDGTVQEISKTSGIERSTTYILLENLTKKGFVRLFEGTPIRYVAQEPGELTRAANKAVEQAEQIYQTVRSATMELETVHASHANTPYATYVDTHLGIATLRDEVKTQSKKKIVYAFLQSPESLGILTTPTQGGHKIVTTQKENSFFTSKDGIDVRIIPQKYYPVASDLFVFQDLIILISDREEFGVRIESSEFAQVMKETFALAWEEAGRLHKLQRRP